MALDSDPVLSRPAVEVPGAAEPQGEAVACTADRLVVIASERAFGP